MSELRVALIAEGPIDAIVITAALKALLPAPFVLTQLQPEATRPKLGTGWGGVLRWCLEFASRGHSAMEEDPTLPGFDLFVLHLDADVAESSYRDVSHEIEELAKQNGWPALPWSVPCPPPGYAVDAIRQRLLAWAGLSAPGPKTVLCVPSKTTGAWLGAAVLPEGHSRLLAIECDFEIEAQLAILPMDLRVKKTTRAYRDQETKITDAWNMVRQRCSVAERFSGEVSAIMA